MKLTFLLSIFIFSVFSFSSFAQDAAVAASDTIAVVSANAAPPAWAQDVLEIAEKTPYVGPYLSKALVYVGVLSTIVTAFIAFLLTGLAALARVLNFAGLVRFAAKVAIFRDGKFMYWLKYISLFNAKKEEKKPEVKEDEKLAA